MLRNSKKGDFPGQDPDDASSRRPKFDGPKQMNYDELLLPDLYKEPKSLRLKISGSTLQLLERLY
jgi:hypothetical protein